jgi:hypothetical protein
MVYNFWTYHLWQIQNSEIIRRNIIKHVQIETLSFEDRPLNPPILGDFELRKVVNSPQSWEAGGKNFSQTRRSLYCVLNYIPRNLFNC